MPVIIERVQDANSREAREGGALNASTFLFGSVFPKGDSADYREWRLRQFQRFIHLGNAGFRTNVFVAKESADGPVIGLAASSFIFKKEAGGKAEDPLRAGSDTVPAVVPPPGVLDESIWAEMRAAFMAPEEEYMGDYMAYQDLIYLAVQPSLQRSGAGTALMRAILDDAGEIPTFLISAPTVSAVPFYLKHGFEILPDESLEKKRIPGLEMNETLCFRALRYLPPASANKVGAENTTANSVD